MTDTIEDELRATLRAVAATYELRSGVEPAVPHTGPRSSFAFLAAAAILVVVLGVGVALLTRDGPDRTGLDVGGSDVAASSTVAPVGDEAWRTGPPAPIRTSVLQFSVWAGREMLVWSSADGGVGSRFDGAAYDPVEDSWRTLDPIDVEGERVRAVVWAGGGPVFYIEELSDRSGAGGPAPGGLRALDTVSGGWETLVSTAPDLTARFSGLRVIDGEPVVEMITERGQRAVLSPDGGVEVIDRSYFPTDGSDAASATIEPTYELITVEPVDLGEELLVGRVDFDTGVTRWSVHTDETVTALPPNPDDPRWWTQATAVWTGAEVIVWGGFSCDPTGGCVFDEGPRTPSVLDLPGD